MDDTYQVDTPLGPMTIEVAGPKRAYGTVVVKHLTSGADYEARFIVERRWSETFEPDMFKTIELRKVGGSGRWQELVDGWRETRGKIKSQALPILVAWADAHPDVFARADYARIEEDIEEAIKKAESFRKQADRHDALVIELRASLNSHPARTTR